MDMVLNDREVRILGCLMEKSMATPEYYPLSLNALVNACNQKSNREPVVSWDEETVRAAAEDLEKKGLAHCVTTGRVPKYEESLTRQYTLVASEAAVLCVLLLRGPQTPGQIRTRTDRLCSFDSLDAVQQTLDRLMEWGLVCQLDRLPGHKEIRYRHMLGAAPDFSVGGPAASMAKTGSDDPLLVRLEARVCELEARLAELEKRVDALSP